jgi:hypothetical protein
VSPAPFVNGSRLSTSALCALSGALFFCRVRLQGRGAPSLGGTVGGAVLQAWLVDIGVVSGINPPWIITIGSSFIGFFAGAYAAIKLGDLTPREK